jgi:hypothetical protein
VLVAVELDGSGSTGPEKKTFSWTVEPLGGVLPILKSADESVARIMATQAGTYRVALTVLADGNADTDQVEG